MDIEQLRDYCLSLPLVTEDMPFGDTTLVFRVRGRIFALTDLERPTLVSLKCDPELAIALRERHEGIAGAYHMNKNHWNQVALDALPPRHDDREHGAPQLRRSGQEAHAPRVHRLPRTDEHRYEGSRLD